MDKKIITFPVMIFILQINALVKTEVVSVRQNADKNKDIVRK